MQLLKLFRNIASAFNVQCVGLPLKPALTIHDIWYSGGYRANEPKQLLDSFFFWKKDERRKPNCKSFPYFMVVERGTYTGDEKFFRMFIQIQYTQIQSIYCFRLFVEVPMQDIDRHTFWQTIVSNYIIYNLYVYGVKCKLYQPSYRTNFPLNDFTVCAQNFYFFNFDFVSSDFFFA